MLRRCLFQCFQLHRNQIAKTREMRPIWEKVFNLSKNVVFACFWGWLRYKNVKVPGKPTLPPNEMTLSQTCLFGVLNATMTIMSHIRETQAAMLKTCLFQCFQLQRSQIGKTHEMRPIWANGFNVSKNVVFCVFFFFFG